jgi:hypothetical protein
METLPMAKTEIRDASPHISEVFPGQLIVQDMSSRGPSVPAVIELVQ